MATVYVKSVPQASWSRSVWDDTGGTNYVVGDRVYVVLADGSQYENLAKTFVCIADNNSTTDPETDTTNWARVGFSEEYPYHAPDGNLNTVGTQGEVYLDAQASRYDNYSTIDPSFYWNAMNFGLDSECTFIFLDGTFKSNVSLGQRSISYVAKNSGKVTIHLDPNQTPVFGYNDGNFTTHEGIIYQLSGGYGLFHDKTKSTFKSCTFTDRESIYGSYTCNGVALSAYDAFTEFKNCLFDLPNAYFHIGGYSAGDGPNGRDAVWENSTFAMNLGNVNQFEPLFYSMGSTTPLEIKKCIFYAPSHIYSDAHNAASASAKFSESIIFSADDTLPEITSDNAGLLVQDPFFVNAADGDFRLRPSSPLIGGIKDSSSNPAGVYIQPGNTTGGSGTFEDPYYMGELGTAETAAAAGDGIIYFVDGEYTISNNLNFYADGITYKSLNKHKAILGSGDPATVAAKVINIGGGYGNTNLDVGNITLEDFYVKNTRFQQVTNSISRPNKIKGLKIEDTHPITHATDGFLWSSGGSKGKLIIDSCSISLDFASESSYYLTRSTEVCEMLSTTLIINFPNAGQMSFTRFESIESSIIYATSQISESGFFNLTENSKNCCFYNIGSSTYGGENTYQGDPQFTDPSSKDFRLRPDSPLIGGIKSDPTNVYYLQPGNPYNGDGSQKDASAMTTDGDPGPFNEFNKILEAGVPYGSTVVIVNGTYSWPNNFHTRKTSANWTTYTYEGYNYIAETDDGVIFDANKQQKHFGYLPFGSGDNYLDLDTTFSGIQFNNVVGGVELSSRNQIYTNSSSPGYGSCTFKKCKFLGWINTSGASSYPWTGGGRSQNGSTMHWEGCEISIAFDNDNRLLAGGDGFADDAYHGAWSWENCTFYIASGIPTFNGRNAANGTYAPISSIFGNAYNQSSRIFKNNIVYNGSGTATLGPNSLNKLPTIQGNCFLGISIETSYQQTINENQNFIDIDPLFVDASNDNFALRPLSPLIGQGK